MADEDTTIGDQIDRLKAAEQPANPGPSGIFTGKRWIIALFLVAGLFFAYVLWHRRQTQSADAAGAANIASDATQAAGVANDAQALATLGQQITGGDQAIQSSLSGIASNASNAARDAAGARHDASYAGDLILQQQHKTPPPHHAPPPAKRGHPVHPAPVLHPAGEKYNHMLTAGKK